MAQDCPYCGQWLSSGDLLQGYCWNCKRTVEPYTEREGGDS
jgi:DNA-directed RNA polymerase subunit RPC12/RpoP